MGIIARVRVPALLGMSVVFGWEVAGGPFSQSPAAPVTREEAADSLDRTVLPIPEPSNPAITTLDAPNAKAPAQFEVKAPANVARTRTAALWTDSAMTPEAKFERRRSRGDDPSGVRRMPAGRSKIQPRRSIGPAMVRVAAKHPEMAPGTSCPRQEWKGSAGKVMSISSSRKSRRRRSGLRSGSRRIRATSAKPAATARLSHAMARSAACRDVDGSVGSGSVPHWRESAPHWA